MPSSNRAVPSWLTREQSAMSPAPASTGGPEFPCTVMTDTPVFPWLVAVMSAVPAATPTTEPRALLAQVTAAPLTGLPFESLASAASCTVPYAGIVAEDGVTSTDATGTVATVIADVPPFPSLVAVIVTGPPPFFPATTPLALTVAMLVSPLVQVIVRPVRGEPLASFGVAVSWTVAPTCTLADAGLTSTDATGTRVWQSVEPVSVNVCPAIGTNCHA